VCLYVRVRVYVCMCVFVCVCVCVCTLRCANSQDKYRYPDGVTEDLRKKYNHWLSFKFQKPLTEPLVLTSDDIYNPVLNIRQHESV